MDSDGQILVAAMVVAAAAAGSRADRRTVRGFALGGATFIAASYLLHCKHGLGPWSCQAADPRRADAITEAS